MKDYTEANRQAWNQVNPIHQSNRNQDLKKEVIIKEDMGIPLTYILLAKKVI
jgi:hypothetical protein